MNGKGLVNCMSFEVFLNLALSGLPDNNQTHCDLSERITFAFTSMEMGTQVVVPLLRVFGRRQILTPTQQTANHYAFLSTSLFWFTRKNYIELDTIVPRLGILSQNGLLNCEEKFYRTKLIRKHLIEQNDRLRVSKHWNFLILATQFVDGTYKQAGMIPTRSQQLNKLLLFLVLCKILLVLSGFILILEIAIGSRSYRHLLPG